MLKRFFAAIALLALVSLASTYARATDTHTAVEPVDARLFRFMTEAAAHRHCPRDTVVWLNTTSGSYDEKGMPKYGRTKHGAYVCKYEADAAGFRDTRKRQ